jgi:hypothetical protein
MLSIGLFVAALVLAIVEEMRGKWQNLTAYAIGAIAIGLLISAGMFNH